MLLRFVIWILSGFLASYIFGWIQGRYEAVYGYDSREVSMREHALIDAFCDRVEAHGPIAQIVVLWIVPIVFWPIWTVMVEIRFGIQALNETDKLRRRS